MEPRIRRRKQNSQCARYCLPSETRQENRKKATKYLTTQKRRLRLAAAALLVFVGLFLKFRISKSTVTANALSRQELSESAGLLADSEYPASLLDLMERYPETTQFVLDYPRNKEKHEKIDISSEVSKGTFPLFLQWDQRWGYETYGDDFLAVNGCGPTCLSMVECGLVGDSRWNPYEVARLAEENGYYVDGVGSSWELMDGGARSLGLQMHEVIYDEWHIVNTLQSGMPIICSMSPGDFTDSGHFIILSGVNSDGTISVLDPNSRQNSEKTWDIETLMPQIKALWAYTAAI